MSRPGAVARGLLTVLGAIVIGVIGLALLIPALMLLAALVIL